MGEHTPTPWFVDLGRWTPDAPVCAFAIRSDYKAPNLPEGWQMHHIAGANISERAAFTACFTPEQIEANAAFIVKAVNSHDALVKALEPFAILADHYPTFDGSLTFGFGGYSVTLSDCRKAREALAKVSA